MVTGKWYSTSVFIRNVSQSCEASPAIWDYNFTCHPAQVNVSHLNNSQTCQYLIYLLWRDKG